MSAMRVPLSVGFPPIGDARARVLVLGSLPGRKSLEMQEYYAQPYNAFWRIMGELVGAGPDLSYRARLARLRARRVAVWDVLAAGEREGSLDSAIVPASMVVNDFDTFFARHRKIELLCFNGNTAAEAERYPMGKRIREVEQGPNGDVWLLEDGTNARLLRLTPI